MQKEINVRRYAKRESPGAPVPKIHLLEDESKELQVEVNGDAALGDLSSNEPFKVSFSDSPNGGARDFTVKKEKNSPGATHPHSYFMVDHADPAKRTFTIRADGDAPLGDLSDVEHLYATVEPADMP